MQTHQTRHAAPQPQVSNHSDDMELDLPSLSVPELKVRVESERAQAREDLKTKRLPASWTNAVVDQCRQIIEEKQESQKPTSCRGARGLPTADDDNHSLIAVADGANDGDGAAGGEGAAAVDGANGARAQGDGQIPVASELSEEDVDDDDDDDYHRRPGLLSRAQVHECQDQVEALRLWMAEKARAWSVSTSTVAHALGLHNTEVRKTSLWNKHQVRHYMEEPRLEGESLGKHRTRCSKEYASCLGDHKEGEPTSVELEEIRKWRKELEQWWEDRADDDAEAGIMAGQRYKVMVDLRKELLERAQWLSNRWQIEVIGFVVTGAPDDVVARTASFGFAGSPHTRAWWDMRNVPTARLLGDFETLCCGEELKSREEGGVFNLSSFEMDCKHRDSRNKAVKDRMLVQFSDATKSRHGRFRWVDFGDHMVSAHKTLRGWPCKVSWPGGGTAHDDLDVEDFKKLYNRFHEEALAGGMHPNPVRYEPWTEEEAELEDGDPGYDDIPLIVSDRGIMLLTIGGIAEGKAKHKASVVEKKMKKAKAAARDAKSNKRTALSSLEDEHSGDESDLMVDSERSKKIRKAKKSSKKSQSGSRPLKDKGKKKRDCSDEEAPVVSRKRQKKRAMSKQYIEISEEDLPAATDLLQGKKPKDREEIEQRERHAPAARSRAGPLPVPPQSYSMCQITHAHARAPSASPEAPGTGNGLRAGLVAPNPQHPTQHGGGGIFPSGAFGMSRVPSRPPSRPGSVGRARSVERDMNVLGGRRGAEVAGCVHSNQPWQGYAAPIGVRAPRTPSNAFAAPHNHAVAGQQYIQRGPARHSPPKAHLQAMVQQGRLTDAQFSQLMQEPEYHDDMRFDGATDGADGGASGSGGGGLPAGHLMAPDGTVFDAEAAMQELFAAGLLGPAPEASGSGDGGWRMGTIFENQDM